MKRWVMVIDLKRCVGCQTCTISCKVANGLGHDVVRCRVIDQEVGKFPDVQRIFVSLRCMHCSKPECVKVCPTGATKQREDGIVTVNHDKCMGCRYCSIACPYQARTFLGLEKRYFPEVESEWENVRYKEHQIGTVDKCDFCCSRIDEGVKKCLEPGRDSDATPVCVISCISKALYFGDLNDTDSDVSILLKKRKNFTMKSELGTEPSLYYLYR